MVQMKKLVMPDADGNENKYEIVDAESRNRLNEHDSAIAAKAEASDLTSEISARINADSVLSARMDTFTQLDDGSTSGDAELIDIRVGGDGTIYASAGAAVRGQASNLMSDIDEITTSLSLDGDSGGVVSGDIIVFDASQNTVKQIAIPDAEIGVTPTITCCGKNMYPKYSSGSSNGLSWTVADDGTITFSGTPTADVLLRKQNIFIPTEGNTQTVALFNNMTNSKLTFYGVTPTNQNNWQVNMTTENATATELNQKDIVELRIRIPKDVDWTGLVLKPMLVHGDTVGEFEEYVGQTYEVTLTDGIVQRTFTLLNGINTLFSNAGTLSITMKNKELIDVKSYVKQEIFSSGNNFYKYETNGNARYLYIYFRSGDNFIRWELHNVPAAASNSDTWQIGRICGLDSNFENLTEIVRAGEFELAFKEHGAADYCGGNNHGDETTDTFILHIDGKQIDDLSTLDGNYHAFSRIDAFEIATVNRCDTPAEDILAHQKVWVFEDGKVKVRQSIKFLEELSVDGCLICMFPALRSAFTHGIRQGSVTVEDMTSSGYAHITTISDNIFYMMFGDNVTAKVIAKTDNPSETSAMWINDTVDLNKLYYGYYGQTNSANPTTVPVNTIIQAESEYNVAYTPSAS